MKRSVSGPLVVIGIGFLFLMNNFYPEIFTWRELWRYWPFLLIGIGVIQLIEVIVNAAGDRPMPVRTISVGGVIASVMFCAILVGLLRHVPTVPWRHGVFFFPHGSIQMFGEEYNFDVKRSLAASASDTRVVLEGLRGNVSVTGDDSPMVLVDGHKSIRSYSQSRAAQANKNVSIEVVRQGSDIVVRAVGDPVDLDARVTYEIDLKIPRRMNFTSHGETDNLTVESLNGNLDVAAEGGNVRLASIGGNARVETSRRKDLIRAVGIKGDLDLRGTGADVQIEDVGGQVTIQGSYFGTLDFRNLTKPLHFESDQTDLRVEKLPGSITMDLGDFRASNVTGPLKLRCQARDVHVEDFSGELEVNVQRGDIDVHPQRTPLAKIDIRVGAGNVDLNIPEKATFALHASTSQGDVENEFGDAIETSSEGRSASMRSKWTSGASITITSDRGTISIKKS
jgi:DUF4097 and DUF4098 domain-containing protein YvlB